MGLLRKFGTDERGISAVIAAVSLIAIFAAATLSVDAGNLWQTRRNMVTATDAAALAEARELAFGGGQNCTGIYNTILDRNAGTDVFDRACEIVHFSAPGTGYVSVEGRKPVRVRFGVVLGLNDTAAYSLSAARVGVASGGRGLRPITFCNENGHIVEWQNSNRGTDPDYLALAYSGDTNGDGLIDHPVGSNGRNYQSLGFGVVHRMYFRRSVDDGQCGSFPGNWGWLNFDGKQGGSGNPEIREWLLEGYSGLVRVRRNDDPSTPKNEQEAPCAGGPGQGNAAESAQGCVPASSGELGNAVKRSLDEILDKPIFVMVTDAGRCRGGGVTCDIEAWAFLGVKLRGYQLTGHPDGRYFDFTFHTLQISGDCCIDDEDADLGTRVVFLCAVDHDPQAINSASRCGARGSS